MQFREGAGMEYKFVYVVGSYMYDLCVKMFNDVHSAINSDEMCKV